MEDEPCWVPSSSRVFDLGEPARMVVVKKLVKGFLRGTEMGLVMDLSGRISRIRFSEIDLPAESDPLT